MKDGEVHLNRKFIEFSKLLNIYLNHFPRAEKFALANRIRNSAYEVYDYITEGEKRYQKKTTLTSLDIAHQRLRLQLYLARGGFAARPRQGYRLAAAHDCPHYGGST